jgi:hypothetical protein
MTATTDFEYGERTIRLTYEDMPTALFYSAKVGTGIGPDFRPAGPSISRSFNKADGIMNAGQAMLDEAYAAIDRGRIAL